MSLTSKDKEILLTMLDTSKDIADLKLVLRTFITLEDFADEKEETD